MSIRLRLTLLYSVILVATLVALGIVLNVAVAQVTLHVAQDALTTETHSLALSLSPHRDGDHQGSPPQGRFQQGGSPYGNGQQGGGPGAGSPYGGSPQGTGGGPGGSPSGGPPPDTFVLPVGTLAPEGYVQVRSLTGTVAYQSPDLQAEHTTLPLSAANRQSLQAGGQLNTTITVSGTRWLLSTVPLLFGSTPIGFLQLARSLYDVDRTLALLQRLLIIGGGIATIIACAAGWVLAGTALRPINRITHTAQLIGTAQDFDRRVEYTGPADEIGRLASTFNTMLSSLQAAYHAQRRFVSDASHELRTPLTSIRGNLGLLQRNPPIAEADRVAVLADLVSESERLSRLVGDLLALARSDAGRPLRQDAVPLGPLVGSAIRRLAVMYPHQIVHQDDRTEATALGDPDALTQVLVILLDNALKFTPPHGTISVTTDRQQDRVTLSVRDTGPGIDPVALPHIFERFYQSDAARTGTGTGLGLSIAQALITRQGGTISVQSQIGQGSTFIVTLPAAAEPATRQRTAAIA